MKAINAALLALAAALPLQALADTVHIYVTRHAEKAADSGDPPLTEVGQQRAQRIAAMLKDAGIKQVFATKYQRTQQTAQPTAAMLGVPVQIYDAAKPADITQQLRGDGKNTLLVGHSNTVPDLVRKLGGEPGSDIAENEYSRLYHLTISDDGKVTTILMHSRP